MRRTAPLRQRINSLVASTSATATAISETANALSSCAQIKIRPMTKVTPSVLRALFAQRRRASTVKPWLLETARTRMNRKIRTTARSTNDLSPSTIRVLFDAVSQSIIVACPLSSVRAGSDREPGVFLADDPLARQRLSNKGSEPPQDQVRDLMHAPESHPFHRNSGLSEQIAQLLGQEKRQQGILAPMALQHQESLPFGHQGDPFFFGDQCP